MMYMCVNGIDFAFFYDFSIEFWKCFDTMALFYPPVFNNRFSTDFWINIKLFAK